MTTRDDENGFLRMTDLVRSELTVGDIDNIYEMYVLLDKAP